nr:hypothetical protein [uncultured Carboxylicivirga sp.]
MKKYILLLSLSLITMVCSSQKKDKREGIYSAYLYEVNVPNGIQKGAIDSINSIYEDSIIKIDWNYANSQIGFELTNKYKKTIKIVWDDAAFVSLTNESNRIFHKGVKYIDRENPQPPTSVYKNTKLTDLIAPTSYTTYVSGQYGGWRSKPLIPISSTVWSKKIEYVQDLIGQTMRIILPINIDDEDLIYEFSFRTEFIEKKKNR